MDTTLLKTEVKDALDRIVLGAKRRKARKSGIPLTWVPSLVDACQDLEGQKMFLGLVMISFDEKRLNLFESLDYIMKAANIDSEEKTIEMLLDVYEEMKAGV